MRVTLTKACELLKQGQVVAIPTETVYGLAASLSCIEGIEQIYALKNRPKNKPLTIHVNSVKAIESYTKKILECFGFDLLANAFWPGPITLIVPTEKEFVAFRIPDHPLALQVLANTGPLVVSSANVSKRAPGTRAEHVENNFGKNFPVLDGGECSKGVESTILIYRGEQWEMSRLGALSPETFEPFLGYQPKIISI